MKPVWMHVLGLLVLAAGSPAQELAKINMDDAARVTPRVAIDTEVKQEGAASVRIMTQWPTTVCLGTVTNLDVEAAKLVYQAAVKTDLAEGLAFLEMWVHIGEGQFYSRGLDNPVKGQTDWQVLQTPFFLQKGQKPAKVTLNLVINGRGTVWIDNLLLTREPLPAQE